MQAVQTVEEVQTVQGEMHAKIEYHGNTLANRIRIRVVPRGAGRDAITCSGVKHPG